MLEYNFKGKDTKDLILDCISSLVVNMIVIMMATKIFKDISVDGIFYLFLTSLLLMLLNRTIKPLFSLVMLPLNIYTLGISYPLVNVFILKFASLLLGSHFVVNGWFSVFFISIFISIMSLVIDALIGKEIRRS